MKHSCICGSSCPDQYEMSTRQMLYSRKLARVLPGDPGGSQNLGLRLPPCRPRQMCGSGRRSWCCTPARQLQRSWPAAAHTCRGVRAGCQTWQCRVNWRQSMMTARAGQRLGQTVINTHAKHRPVFRRKTVPQRDCCVHTNRSASERRHVKASARRESEGRRHAKLAAPHQAVASVAASPLSVQGARGVCPPAQPADAARLSVAVLCI